MSKEIEVTGCGNCPIADTDRYCRLAIWNVAHKKYENTTPENCPLKEQPITIKLKEDNSNANTEEVI